MELSIILPSYLEEENLRILLPRIDDKCRTLAPDYEILVVDTQEPMDGTPQACQEMENVRYINRTPDNSYGSAVRTGIQQARGESIVFMDADGSHHPEFLENLFAEKQAADIVVASRYVDGGATENKMILVWMSQMVNLGYSIVLGIKCKDISNSFKLYRAELLKPLELKCQNFDIVEEILYKCLKRQKDLKILELPFCFKQRMFGETKRNLIKFVFTYIATLIKLRFS